VFLIVPRIEYRLVIERIDVRNAPGHEEKNNPFGTRGEVRRFRGKAIADLGAGRFARKHFLEHARKQKSSGCQGTDHASAGSGHFKWSLNRCTKMRYC
jgi:hypothetical protein